MHRVDRTINLIVKRTLLNTSESLGADKEECPRTVSVTVWGQLIVI